MIWNISKGVLSTQRKRTKVTALMAVFLLTISSLASALAPFVQQQVSAAASGDVWITAAMPDPAVGGTEYVKVKNNTAGSLSLDNWVVNDGSNHTISASSSLAAGAEATICPVGSFTTPPCTSGYSITALGLDNTDDTITLEDSSDSQIDQVNYTAGQVTQGSEVAFSHTPPATVSEITNIDAYYVKSNYKGIGVDIHVDKLTDATGVEIKVDRANGGSVIKTNKSTGGVLDTLNTGNPAVTTAPIVIQQGTYNEAGSSSWNQPTATWDNTTVPTSITVTITRSGGASLVQTIPISQVTTPFATLAEVMPAAAPTSSTETIISNTSAGENQPGWMFNRDVSTSTPFEFNTDAASIGGGSLYIKPIGSNPSNKMVAELFYLKKISEINSISYDFKTDNAADADQFYLNLYVNDGSNPAEFYDCRYAIAPTTTNPDPTTGFTTFTYNLSDPASFVNTRGTASISCPITPADLASGAVLRAIAINVGDTTANDVGVEGYLDNVVLSTATAITTYDFEYAPDPTNSHVLNLSGDVYRDIALDNCDNLSECKNERTNEMLEGWEMRLYKEDSSGSWQNIDSDTTDADGVYKFASQSEEGIYHVCEVVKAGWTQPIQTWSGSGYKVDTANLSGNISEGKYCTTTVYTDQADKSSKSHFGNVDTKKPFTQVLSPAENGIHNSTLVINIRSTDNESGIVKAVANLYGSSGLVGTCVNQTVNPAEAHHDFTCTVDVDSLDDGDYYIKTNAKDAGGLLSNTVNWSFKVDNTPPAIPALTSPDDGVPINGTSPVANDWEDVSDADHYIYQSYNVDGSGNCILSPARFTGTYTDSQTNSRTLPDGLKFCWRVKAVDAAGNESGWSQTWKTIVDNTAPNSPNNLKMRVTSSSTNIPDGGTTNKDDVTASWDSNNSEPVTYVYKYWNDIPGNPYKVGHEYPVDTSSLSYAGTINQGEGVHHFCVVAVDLAGNESLCSAPFTVTYDSTAPVLTITTETRNSNGTYTITGTTDDPADVTVSIDGTPLAPVTPVGDDWTVITGALAAGSYVVTATSTDAAGNATNPVPSDNFTVPDSSSTTSGRGLFNAGAVTGAQNSAPTILNNLAAVFGAGINANGGAADNNSQSVLGAQTDNTDNSNKNESNKSDKSVLGDSTDKDGCSKLLGLCWYYWVPIVVVIAGIVYYFFRRRQNSEA